MDKNLRKQIEEAKKELEQFAPVAQASQLDAPSPIKTDQIHVLYPTVTRISKSRKWWLSAIFVGIAGVVTGTIAIFAIPFATRSAAQYFALGCSAIDTSNSTLYGLGCFSLIYRVQYPLFAVLCLIVGLLFKRLKITGGLLIPWVSLISLLPIILSSSYSYNQDRFYLVPSNLVAIILVPFAFFAFFIFLRISKLNRWLLAVLAILLSIMSYFLLPILICPVLNKLDTRAGVLQSRIEKKSALDNIDFKMFRPGTSNTRFTLTDVIPNTEFFYKPPHLQLTFNDTKSDGNLINVYEYKKPNYYRPPTNCGYVRPSDISADDVFGCKLLKKSPKGRDIYGYSQYYAASYGYTTEELKNVQPESFYFELDGTVISMEGFVDAAVTPADIIAFVDSYQVTTSSELQSVNNAIDDSSRAKANNASSSIAFDSFVPSYTADKYYTTDQVVSR